MLARSASSSSTDWDDAVHRLLLELEEALVSLLSSTNDAREIYRDDHTRGQHAVNMVKSLNLRLSKEAYRLAVDTIRYPKENMVKVHADLIYQTGELLSGQKQQATPTTTPVGAAAVRRAVQTALELRRAATVLLRSKKKMRKGVFS